MRQPDGILAGMIDKFGWKAYQNGTFPNLFTLPPTTAGAVAASLQKLTGARTIRIVGNPEMPVNEVALLPGASEVEKQIRALEQENVQLLVAGESREWETVPYVQDAVAQGRHKALILLGPLSQKKPAWKSAPAGCKRSFPEDPRPSSPLASHFKRSDKPFLQSIRRGAFSGSCACALTHPPRFPVVILQLNSAARFSEILAGN
jgi:hypothetical protein